MTVPCHLFLWALSFVGLCQWLIDRNLCLFNPVTCPLAVTRRCPHRGQLLAVGACDACSETLSIFICRCSPQTAQLPSDLPVKHPISCTSCTSQWHDEQLWFRSMHLSMSPDGIWSSVGHFMVSCVRFPLLNRNDMPSVSRKSCTYYSPTVCTSSGRATLFIQPISRHLDNQLHKTRRDQCFVCQELLTTASLVYPLCLLLSQASFSAENIPLPSPRPGAHKGAGGWAATSRPCDQWDVAYIRWC